MEYKEIKSFLEENNVTDKEMDKIWVEQSEKNWKVKSLIKCGKDWSDLQIPALKSLLKLKESE